MKKISLGFVVSGLFFLLSLAWLGYTRTMPFSSSVTSFGGPATFPFLVLSIMAVGAGIVTVAEFCKMRKGTGALFPDRATICRIGLLFLVSVVYVGVIESIGYIPATIFLVLASLMLFGVRDKRALVLVPVLFPAAIFLLFQKLLQVQLP